MPQYTDTECGPALGHRISIPFTLYGIDTEDFGYTLGDKDYSISTNSSNAKISIKSGRFIKELSAVNKVFDITLSNLTADTFSKLKTFAKQDLLFFLSNGSGNITLDLEEVDYSSCYLDTPITSSESIYDPSTGIEYFQEVKIRVVRPFHSWY